MDNASAQAEFLGLPREEQIETLIRLCHELTIVARDTYEVGGSGLVHPARLRRINEVQHRICGQILALLRNDPHRYPNVVLMGMISEHDDDPELQRQFQRAFSRTMTQPALA